MARINIEDELFHDPRFTWLNEITQGKAFALLIPFWFAAQRRWAENKSLLPESEYLPIWKPLIEVGLAEKRDTGIYAKGAEERFEWILSMSEKGRKGGRASAAARREKYGTAQPVSEPVLRSFAEPTPNQPEAPSKLPNPLTLTPILVPALTPIQNLKRDTLNCSGKEEVKDKLGYYTGYIKNWKGADPVSEEGMRRIKDDLRHKLGIKPREQGHE